MNGSRNVKDLKTLRKQASAEESELTKEMLMSRIVTISSALACAVLFTANANAQTVGMAGEYIEGNGIIVNIPQNPPLVACDPAAARCVGKRDLTTGQLVTSMTTAGGTTTVAPPLSGTGTSVVPFIRNGPSFGVYGAQFIDAPNGLATDGTFTVPPLAFQQRLGKQVGQVLNSTVRQLDTTFTAAMPGTNRNTHNGVNWKEYTVTAAGGRGAFISTNTTFVPNADTRVMKARTFSAGNVAAHGQNNGLSTMDPNYMYRAATNTVVNDTYAADVVSVSYENAGGAFGGTMTILLDGTGRLYLAAAGLDANFSPPSAPNGLAPIIGTNPVGDTIPGFNDRNGAGFGYTVVGRQLAGKFKAYGVAVPAINPAAASSPNAQGVPCGATAFNSTCNLIAVDFDDAAIGQTVAPLAGATSTKFMFPWTAGTVSIVRTGPRLGVIRQLTQTGMGYDSTTTGGNRNVGLVAGSYTKRIDGNGTENINSQMAGADITFTPEPGATVALISGLGLLGALAARRRS
jgi:hypothetical protein